jgi:polyisoprenoid-binding protein YceI
MKKLLIAAVAVLAVAGVAYGGFIWYEHSHEQAETSLSDTAAKRQEAPRLTGSPDGDWIAADGSRAGYRVEDELLRGASVTATGYTDRVDGSMQLADGGTTISSATFTIDVASITSKGFGQRDNAFRRVMEADTFPTATFRLTRPVHLSEFPAEDHEVKVPDVAGTLTLHGVSRDVTFDATAIRGGARIDVKAEIPIDYTDFGVDNPSNALARIGDRGIIDMAVGFTKQAR